MKKILVSILSIVAASGVFIASKFWYDLAHRDAPYCVIVTASALAIMSLILYEYREKRKRK